MKTQETSNKVIYPYLPNGCNFLYTDESNSFMFEAKKMAMLSNEKQQPTGAVVVCDGKIISKASSHNPLSNSILINLHKKFCIRHMLHIPTGEKYWMCPGCANKKSHAEYKAIEKLLKTGNTIAESVYLWGHLWCCDVCWGNMLKLGIHDVYLLEGSHELFNPRHPKNIIGHQFDN